MPLLISKSCQQTNLRKTKTQRPGAADLINLPRLGQRHLDDVAVVVVILHVVLEDSRRIFHLDNVEHDELAERRQEVAPLVQDLDLVRVVALLFVVCFDW